MQSDDAALVARAGRGDDDAFREIFERHHRFVYRFLYAMTGNHHEAEELLQQTFIAAHGGLTSLRHEARLTTWLCAIARNLAAKSYRRAAREIDVEVASLQTPERALLDDELSRAIAHALLELDEDKRTVFTLKMIQGLSYEEIAAITGSAVAKLKSDLCRAKGRMRALLAAYREGRS
ncbi:MAG TPA: sigma-70 family RNA polymerase sigma factor [Thermoanaerobaculia bacterium]|jgi:RNA polymerase sigma-70 factor (ECF subfamily)